MLAKWGARLAVLFTTVTLGLLSPATAMAAGATTLAPAAAMSSAAIQELCGSVLPFAARNFGDATPIRNPYLPAIPTTRYVYDGTANTDEGPVRRRIVTTVTDFTKLVNGVRTFVIWDRDFDNGVLQEEELTFWAQDNRGNVWNLGEYPEEYQDGRFAGAPSTWIAGQDGARAGVLMLGAPAVGARYLQGFAPAVDFLDCGEVVRQGVKICNPGVCYDRVLVVDESSPLEPDSGIQRKFHAPGVGVVRIEAVGDAEAETLTLTSMTRLGPQGLTQMRDAVRRLEHRAYRISHVYRQTAPARLLL